MIPAVATWFFLIAFPVLLDQPVSVRVETASAGHCHRVRKLLTKQLDQHRSNAVVSPCTLGIATVLPDKEITP